MSYLLDTHILLWVAAGSDRLTDAARRLIDDPANTPVFSAVSLWEIAIKSGLGRDDFQVDATRSRNGLLDSGYVELPVTGLMPPLCPAFPSSIATRSIGS